ncbi:MAG: hypothetical protein FJW39_34575 [Acidobacteria bacterium]|nr:hypothetical protein [Acidobacteriota bacterium]
MATQRSTDSAALLESVRRRGQFLISTLMWALAAGFAITAAGWLGFFYHHTLSVAEKLRHALGFKAPETGIDWLFLAVLAVPPFLAEIAILTGWIWYRRLWDRRLAEVWPDETARSRHTPWRRTMIAADDADKARRQEYLTALMASPAWKSGGPHPDAYEPAANAAFQALEPEIVERAFTTGLIVGVSGNRFVDALTILSAALEIQLHVLTRLGKRPSFHTWKLLLQRTAASLFVNSYLTRQDALLVNLAIKKAGIGLQAAGDVLDSAASQLTDHDIDLDDLLHLNSLEGVPLAALFTKSLEVAATMTLTVGKQGLYALGHLIESAGDQLAQGAIAAAILYHHGTALAADTLAMDGRHRAAPELNPSFAHGLRKMTALAGDVLLDAVRRQRTAFRERRSEAVKRLPKKISAGIKERMESLLGSGG